MNNREYLNTLSDEEFNEIVTVNDDNGNLGHCDSGATNCNKYADVCSDGSKATNCTRCQLAWLQAEHITTADEDFAEIGFVRYETDDNSVQYSNEVGTVIVVTKLIEYVCTNYQGFDLKKADQIRTIADKKRKEVWG